MPTYSYVCSACGHAFDIQQSFSEHSLTTCPSCEQVTLRKVFSAVGVVFKGSGFYRNDARAAAKGKTSPSTSGSSGTSDSKDGGTTTSAGTGGTETGRTGSGGGSGSGNSSGSSSTSTPAAKPNPSGS